MKQGAHKVLLINASQTSTHWWCWMDLGKVIKLVEKGFLVQTFFEHTAAGAAVTDKHRGSEKCIQKVIMELLWLVLHRLDYKVAASWNSARTVKYHYEIKFISMETTKTGHSLFGLLFPNNQRDQMRTVTSQLGMMRLLMDF